MEIISNIIKNRILNGDDINSIMYMIDDRIFEDCTRIRELEEEMLKEYIARGNEVISNEIRNQYEELIQKQNKWRDVKSMIIQENNLVKVDKGWEVLRTF